MRSIFLHLLAIPLSVLGLCVISIGAEVVRLIICMWLGIEPEPSMFTIGFVSGLAFKPVGDLVDRCLGIAD